MRSSNYELCRICCMFLIVLLHTTYASFGWPDNSNINYLVIVFSSMSIFGVDVFILLTGYFSVKFKKQSFMNLLFICFFSGGVNLIIRLLSYQDLSINNLFFISQSSWYIPMYIGLLIISPILNRYIDNSEKQELLYVIMLILAYNVYFEFFPHKGVNAPGFHSGLSLIWFMVAYLVGRYLKLYGLPNWISKHSLICCVLSIICIAFSQILIYKVAHPELIPYFLGQNNPLVLFAAISFITCFSKLNIQSVKINYFAQSTLSVLLIHNSTAVMPLTSNFFIALYSSETNMFLKILIWFMLVTAIYIICVLIDQIRIIIFNRLIKPIII